MKNLPVRMCVNLPSTLDQYHHLHGKNVLAMREEGVPGTARIYFLSGPVISQQIPWRLLSPGWFSDKPKGE